MRSSLKLIYFFNFLYSDSYLEFILAIQFSFFVLLMLLVLFSKTSLYSNTINCVVLLVSFAKGYLHIFYCNIIRF